LRYLELAAATFAAAMGLRSLVHWIRRPFDSTDPVDHLLYAAFVAGRVGTWWVAAAYFGLSATLTNPDPRGGGALLQGRAYADVFRAEYAWMVPVFVAFAALQVVVGFVLGRRVPTKRDRPDRSQM
jgi:hypothetical protein